MKYNFKKGDIVKLKPGGGEQTTSVDWVHDFIKENQNKTFRVVDVDHKYNLLGVKDILNKQPRSTLNMSRFIKVKPYDKLLFTDKDIEM